MSSSPSAPGRLGSAPDDGLLRIAMPGIPNFAHLPGHLAKDLGLFDARGLTVEIVRGKSGFACFGLVQAGVVDIAWTSTVGMLRAAAHGEADHLRMTFSPIPRIDIQVAALPGIDNCADFRGRSVAVQGPGTFTHAMLDAYLSRCGLQIDSDVDQVTSDPEDFGAVLAEGRAVGCAGHADDLAWARYQFCPDLKILANAWEYLPDFHYASYVMDASLLEDRRDVGGRFVAAVLEAAAWLVDPANRDEVIHRAVSITTQPEEVVRSSYDMYVGSGLFSLDCGASIPTKMLTATAQHQIDLGIIDRIPDLEKAVDRSLCVDAMVT